MTDEDSTLPVPTVVRITAPDGATTWVRVFDCGEVAPGVIRCAAKSGDTMRAFDHQVSDGPIALVERAIYKLRRAGLK